MQRRTHALITLVALAAPVAALAHPGHTATASLAQGFLHPLTGADHLLAMLAVGMWSALCFPRRAWLVPFCFAAMLLAGALSGTSGAWVEPAIAASLIATGIAVATRRTLPLAAGALLVGGFAWAHGAAHGAELHGPAALAGMVAATALLHVAGLFAGQALKARSRWLGAALGGGVALFGAGLLLA